MTKSGPTFTSTGTEITAPQKPASQGSYSKPSVHIKPAKSAPVNAGGGPNRVRGKR